MVGNILGRWGFRFVQTKELAYFRAKKKGKIRKIFIAIFYFIIIFS